MKLYPYFFIALLAFACTQNNAEDSQELEGMYAPAPSVPLKMDGGYDLNQASGDSIPVIINSTGDTIATGTPLVIEGTLQDPSMTEPAVKTAATSFDQLPTFNAHPNRIKAADIEVVRTVNTDSLGLYSFDADPFVLVTSIGDTVETGVPVTINGKSVPLIQPDQTDMKGMAMKVNSSAGVRYLDVEQGLTSPYVLDVIQDMSGNIWLASWGEGISRYDGNSLLTYTIENGLVGRNIRSIVQDHDGNLWIATWGEGICKFDGRGFTHYTEVEGIAATTVWGMFVDSQNNVWIAPTFNGLIKYDGETFTHYTSNEGLGGMHVRAFYEDTDGSIYFGSMGGGVSVYKNGKISTYLTQKGGLISNDVRSLFKDSKGNMWIGTSQGLCQFDGEVVKQYAIEHGAQFLNVQSIVEDDLGNIVFGSEKNGISIYDGEYFTHIGEAEGLTDQEVWTIMKDDAGNLWIGTNAGLNHIHLNTFNNYSEEQGVANNVIWSATTDAEGNVWFGTTGFGASIYDGNTFRTLGTAEGNPGEKITSIDPDSQGNIWLGTGRNGATMYDGSSFTTYGSKQGFCNTAVWDIEEDANGHFWFATDGMGVYKFDGNNWYAFNEAGGFSSNYVYTIFEDDKGDLWFGTWGGGVAHYDFEKFTFYSTKEGFLSNNICSIIQDYSGAYWFVSDDQGVMKFEDETLTYFRTEQGINVNSTASIIEDADHNIWISSTEGFNLLQEQEDGQYHVRSFKKEDGLNSTSFLTDAVTMDQANNLWWGSGQGIVKLAAKHADFVPKTPSIQMNSVSINERQYDFSNAIDEDSVDFSFDTSEPFYNVPKNLKLSYDQNHLTFFYSALEWGGPEKIMYSHKIQGLNRAWSKPSTETKAEYRNIPYGNYTFQVKAINESGVWSETYDFAFSISPPWWHSWWARVLYALLAIFAVFGVVKWRTANLKERQKELEYQIEIATHEIREQHEEIMDSIAYAKRIQTAILPPHRIVKEYLQNSFILYKPKDVVAGDFYWMEQKNGKTLFAAADCTGHGVPGAMVSVICNNALNRSVREHGIDDPGKILDKAREIVISEFEKSDEEVKDGMDIALCSLQGLTLEYAGAHNPLWIVRSGEIIETKANKQPIGKFDKLEPYTTHKFELQAGDTFYIFSDGFVDQFGGEKGKKFKAKAFRELLLSIQDKPMEEQRKVIDEVFEDWRGSIEQIDDVCVIGVRV